MWRFICCAESDANLALLLACGQSFRWRKVFLVEEKFKIKLEEAKQPGLDEKASEKDVSSPLTTFAPVWAGVLSNRLWLLMQTNNKIFYRTLPEKSVHLVSNTLKRENKDAEEILVAKPRNSEHTLKVKAEAGVDECVSDMEEEDILKDYLQLSVDIPALYKKWSDVDPNFKQLERNFTGIRMLRQDPVENLFSFICSQNNNISRIGQLVEKLCNNYGDLVTNFQGESYYSFPPIEKLAGDSVEEELRKLSFGYRAKFINASAKKIMENGAEDWLWNLRKVPYKEAHEALCSLPGVGAKVADCVCLMSLDKTDAIPIDTHMWQIAMRDYLPHLAKNKTLTDRTYQEIGKFWRELHGEYAGWAHSVLFSADLKRFKDLKEDAKGGQNLPPPKKVAKTDIKKTVKIENKSKTKTANNKNKTKIIPAKVKTTKGTHKAAATEKKNINSKSKAKRPVGLLAKTKNTLKDKDDKNKKPTATNKRKAAKAK